MKSGWTKITNTDPGHQILRGAFVIGLAILAIGVRPSQAQTDPAIYYPQPGTPAAIPNFINPDAGCKFAGIGGQVFDLNGLPVSGLVVQLGGTFADDEVSRFAVSGSSLQFGSGGYDFRLADQPTASKTLEIQLLDAAGTPLSPPTKVITYATCERNLIVFNWREVLVDNMRYFPFIGQR